MSDTHQTRVRYDRAAALLLSTGVTLFALLAGLGVIGTGMGAPPASAGVGISSPGSGSASERVHDPVAVTPPGDDQAVKAASNAALPAASGSGRRAAVDTSRPRAALGAAG